MAKKKENMTKQTSSYDKFIYSPVLMASIGKISSDDNWNLSCSDKKNIVYVSGVSVI